MCRENIDNEDLVQEVSDITELGTERVLRLIKIYSTVQDLKEGFESLIEDIREPEKLRHQSAVATWVEAEKLHKTSSSRSISKKKKSSTKGFSKFVQVTRRYVLKNVFFHSRLIYVS